MSEGEVRACVVAGSYEGHLVGLDVVICEGARCGSTPAFAFSPHEGCIRAMAASSAKLVTGSTDNTLAVYDLRKRRFHGKLLQKDGGGSPTCVRFFGASHMLSGSDDGELCIWRTSDWECLVRMKGHRGSVYDFAIHPTGRIALSVAADNKLMLWNLTTGKCNYTFALPQPSRLVRWAPAGDSYLVGTQSSLLLFGLSSSAPKWTTTCDPKAPLCGGFASEGLFVGGGDDGTLHVWRLDDGALACSVPKAHGSRIKAIEVFTADGAPGAAGLLASASSAGEVGVWRLGATGPEPTLQQLLLIPTRLRLTSLGIGEVKSIPASTASAAGGRAEAEAGKQEVSKRSPLAKAAGGKAAKAAGGKVVKASGKAAKAGGKAAKAGGKAAKTGGGEAVDNGEAVKAGDRVKAAGGKVVKVSGDAGDGKAGKRKAEADGASAAKPRKRKERPQ